MVTRLSPILELRDGWVQSVEWRRRADCHRVRDRCYDRRQRGDVTLSGHATLASAFA